MILVGPLKAQEAGIFATVGSTNVEELGDPSGGGGYIAWFPIDRLGLRFDYTRSESSVRWPSTTCDSGFPEYEGCVDETVETEASHDVLEWGFVLVPIRLKRWRTEASVGVARVDQEYEIRGADTGRILDRSQPGSGMDLEFNDLSGLFGADRNAWFWGIGLTRTQIAGRPITIGLHWRRRSTKELGCLPDAFCVPWRGGFRMDEFRLSAGWSF